MVAKAVHGLFYLFEIRTFFELWHCGTRSLATDGREFYQTGLTDRRPIWVVESGGPKKTTRWTEWTLAPRGRYEYD